MTVIILRSFVSFLSPSTCDTRTINRTEKQQINKICIIKSEIYIKRSKKKEFLFLKCVSYTL